MKKRKFIFRNVSDPEKREVEVMAWDIDGAIEQTIDILPSGHVSLVNNRPGRPTIVDWQEDNTCPNCGEIRGEGRLCSKCVSALSGADDWQ